MARLEKGVREEHEQVVLRLLKRLRWGVKESEIAQELGWQRRTVNNYLQVLGKRKQAHREGRSWFAG